MFDSLDQMKVKATKDQQIQEQKVSIFSKESNETTDPVVCGYKTRNPVYTSVFLVIEVHSSFSQQLG